MTLTLSGTGKITTDIYNDVTRSGNPWSRFLLSCNVGKDKFTTVKAMVFDQNAISALDSLKKCDLVEFSGIFSKNEWTNKDGIKVVDDTVKVNTIGIFSPPAKQEKKPDFDESPSF